MRWRHRLCEDLERLGPTEECVGERDGEVVARLRQAHVAEVDDPAHAALRAAHDVVVVQVLVHGAARQCPTAEEGRHLSLVELREVAHERARRLRLGPAQLRAHLWQVGAHGGLARGEVPRVLARRGGVREGEHRAVEQRGRPAERRSEVGGQRPRGRAARPHAPLQVGEHAHEVARAARRLDARDRAALALALLAAQLERRRRLQRRPPAVARQVARHVEHRCVLALQLRPRLARVGHLDHIRAASGSGPKVEVALTRQPRDGGDLEAKLFADEGGDLVIRYARPAEALEVLPRARGVGRRCGRGGHRCGRGGRRCGRGGRRCGLSLRALPAGQLVLCSVGVVVERLAIVNNASDLAEDGGARVNAALARWRSLWIHGQ